jgi:hypothetical protein
MPQVENPIASPLEHLDLVIESLHKATIVAIWFVPRNFLKKVKLRLPSIENRVRVVFLWRGNYCAINGTRVASQGVNCWI